MRFKILLLWAILFSAMGMVKAQNYLCFTAITDNSSVGIREKARDVPDMEYSLDEGASWTPITSGAVDLPRANDKVYFRGNNAAGIFNTVDVYTNFFVSGKVSASGSVMSLIDGEGTSTEIPYKACFYGLFKDCEGLVQAPELPATTLTEDCYKEMFSGSGLKEAPELPATELEEGCYEAMFANCADLTKAPVLPSRTMKQRCYSNMFSNCTSLVQAPELPSTTLAIDCYLAMFEQTAIVQAPSLPSTVLAERCYSNMFYKCASLTVAPELPATDLTYRCYCGMFSNCASLTQAPELPATRVRVESCYVMFANCTSLVEAPALPAMELDSACYR